MIPRCAALAPALTPALGLLLAACGGDRNERVREPAAVRDSLQAAAPAPPGAAADDDSLSALVTVVEFVEAGGPGVVPVLRAVPDSTAADVGQHAALLGSVGPYAFTRQTRYAFTCGAHGMTSDSFAVLDLARRQPAELVGDSARAALVAEYRAEAAAAFKADTAPEQPFNPDSIALTMMIPRLAGERLALQWQFTTEDCYVCSDGRWSSYTRSVVLPARALPEALAPYATVPVEVQTALRVMRVPPDSAAGWSEVALPRGRRDALARLFGVTAPAGGREFLVWRRTGPGAFETVWLRGGGVEATIVGRRPDAWIVAGARAWSWRARAERVATTPCSLQMEKP